MNDEVDPNDCVYMVRVNLGACSPRIMKLVRQGSRYVAADDSLDISEPEERVLQGEYISDGMRCFYSPDLNEAEHVAHGIAMVRDQLVNWLV